MDPQVQDILQKVASYIEMVQPQLDKQNEQREIFSKKAHQTADVLVSRGLLNPQHKTAFVERIIADETGTALCDVVQKMAESVTADGLGQASSKQAMSGTQDPFEREFFGERRAAEVV